MNEIEAAIGIILKKNKVYITKGKYKKNIWEFPGGKVKKHENIIHALKRELLEEAGIIILKFTFFQFIEYINLKNKLKLYFFLIKKWKGRPYSVEGYFYTWQILHDLNFLNFPPANRNIITSLQKILIF